MSRQIVHLYVFVLTLLEITIDSRLTAQGKSNGVIHDGMITEGPGFAEWATGSLSSAPLVASPASLEFGDASLGIPHVRRVTLTNVGNDTMHLASVAGSTPDFHASFFDTKTLAPGANTSFSVVYVGRQEGFVTADLYIHTSLGLHKYPVSSTGVGGEWGIWPLVGVVVPANTTITADLWLRNPTEHTVQVYRIASSASWIRLSAGGGASEWSIQSGSRRRLGSLSLRGGDVVRRGFIGVWLKHGVTVVLPVDTRPGARGAVPGTLHLHQGLRGHRDQPHTVELLLSNSAPTPVDISVTATGQCGPLSVPPPPAVANGGKPPAPPMIKQLITVLPANSEAKPAVAITFHWTLMAGSMPLSTPPGTLCRGAITAGGVSVPYSVRLLHGTLFYENLHFVPARGEKWLRVRNDFRVPIQLLSIELDEEAHKYFELLEWAGGIVRSGQFVQAARLAARGAGHGVATVRTNVTAYTVHLLAYSGNLDIWWSSPPRPAPPLRVQVSELSLRNPAPTPLCYTLLLISPCMDVKPVKKKLEHGCLHIGATIKIQIKTRAVKRGRCGVLALLGEGGGSWGRSVIVVRTVAGFVRPGLLQLKGCAPLVECSSPLVIWSSVANAMQFLSLTSENHTFSYTKSGVPVSPGRTVVGHVYFEPTVPSLYKSLNLTDETESWLTTPGEEGVRLAGEVARGRLAGWEEKGGGDAKLYLHTSLLRDIQIPVSIQWRWPRLVEGASGGCAVGAVGGRCEFSLTLRNPSRYPLRLALQLAGHLGLPNITGGSENDTCTNDCVWAVDSYQVTWSGGVAGAAGLIIKEGGALIINVAFTPVDERLHRAYLYILNNITGVEAVLLEGRGAIAKLELGGRPSGGSLVLEVSECDESGRGIARLHTVLRNTGDASVSIRNLNLAGGNCKGRGFKAAPCTPGLLPPSASRRLELAFSADWTGSRARSELRVLDELGHEHKWELRAAIPARLLARCAPRLPPPPAASTARFTVAVIALAASVASILLGALDAEQVLKRALLAMRRSPVPTPQPLDLKALQSTPPRAPSPPKEKKKKPQRPRTSPPARFPDSPRAFDQWKSSVLSRAAPAASTALPLPPPPSEGIQEEESHVNETEECEEYVPPDEPPVEIDETYEEEQEEPEPITPPVEDEEEDEEEEIEIEPESESPTSDKKPEEDATSVGTDSSTGDSVPREPPTSAERKSIKENKSRSTRRHGEERRCRTRKERTPRRRVIAPAEESPDIGEVKTTASVVRGNVTFSSVVCGAGAVGAVGAAGPIQRPLPPIGTGARRRSPQRTDQSLFYFNGDRPPPPPTPPTYDYTQYAGNEESWGWSWVRPPPGFAPPPAPIRAYDPFHAMAAIWAPDRPAWTDPPAPTAPTAPTAPNTNPRHGWNDREERN